MTWAGKCETTMNDDMRLKVKTCSACHNTHESMLFVPLRDPLIDIYGNVWTHKGLCPETGTPVYVREVRYQHWTPLIQE